MDERKRLYKSRNNKMICGVCAGIADYFNIDPSIVRVLWAVLALGGPRSGRRYRRARLYCLRDHPARGRHRGLTA